MHVHLVRHGEVANPNHVVYGDLPGFNLSARGVLQVHATAARLSREPIAMVLTSPLARAVQSATAIASRHGLRPVADLRLLESRQFDHWTGLTWEAVAERYRSEFDAYLVDATSVVGGPETIQDVADRLVAAIVERIPADGDIVVVGHQDPIQAAILALTGRSLSQLRRDPPGHASVVTLLPSPQLWSEVDRWEPPG